MPHSKEGKLFTDLLLEGFRFNGALLAAGDRLAAEFDLTSSRWQVMGAVVDGPLSVPQIARQMGLTRQAVQKTANLLQHEGLIEFRPNPNHQTSRLVAQTAEGTKRYEALDAVQQTWANKKSQNLKLSDLETAFLTIQALRRNIEGSKE